MDNFGNICGVISAPFDNMSDFGTRKINALGVEYAVFYIQNFSSRELINRYVIAPITELGGTAALCDIVQSVSLSKIDDPTAAHSHILDGACVIASSDGELYYAMTNSEDGRSPSEPETENVIRGAHEGFTENGSFNAMLLRRRIRSTHLKREDVCVGSNTKTTVSIMYLDDVIRQDVLLEVRSRISKIQIDGILDSGYVEQYIQDGKYSVYPTVGNSERPDKVAAKILEGRAAIIVDGSPVVLTVPYLFIEGFQVTEDYSKSAFFSSFERTLRFFGMMMSLFLPAFLLAANSVLSLVGGRLGEYLESVRADIRIPLAAELIIVFIIFELVREVGLRMPKAVGSAVGLVGSLIIGDSAVEAGLISSPVLIAVAFSAVCNFLAPPYMNSNVVFRAYLILSAGLFGYAGFFFSTAAAIIFFCSKQSFGTPYFSPFSPVSKKGLADFLIMLPLARKRFIPSSVSGKKIVRSEGREK